MKVCADRINVSTDMSSMFDFLTCDILCAAHVDVSDGAEPRGAGRFVFGRGRGFYGRGRV